MNKNFRIITQEELEKIIDNLEGDYADFKSIRIVPKNLEQSIVAFANSCGGEVYVGIEDDYSVKGGKNIEVFNDIITQIYHGINPLVVDLEHEFLKYKDEFILLIKIPYSSDLHETSSRDVYVRKGSLKKKIGLDQINQLKSKKGIIRFEERTKDIDLSLITESEYMRGFLERMQIHEKPIDYLKKNNFIYNGKPRISAILCFCDRPQSVIKCGIRVYRYEFQKQSRQYEYSRERVSDQDAYETGTLEVLIKNAIDKIQSLLIEMKIQGRYPQKAIQEALVNAVLHRDYAIQDEIHIRIYDNILEIISPGGFPGNITEKNILKASRIARNPQILDFLFQISALEKDRDARLNQNAGEGIKTIFNEMKKASLADPIFKETDSENGRSVIVVLRHASAESYSKKVLRHLKENESISNKEAREITREEDKERIKNVFKRLEERGDIERVDYNAPKSKIRYRLKRKNLDSGSQGFLGI